MQTHTNRPNQIVKQPPLPPNQKLQSNLLTPREPYLIRTNSNLKSFKKNSVQKSTKQKEIEQQIKYANTYKTDASFQRSFVHSEKKLGIIVTHGPFQETTTTLNQIKKLSKSRKGSEKQQNKSSEKIISNRPFDVLSGTSPYNQHKNKDKNDDYYLYWKNKAHQYLESNMKLMEDVSKLTKQNQQLKHHIQNIQKSKQSTLKIQINNSEVFQKSIKKQQNRQNNYLLQKIEQLQRILQKKEIVIKAYEQKIIQLNNKVVGDNDRTRLINKLKSQIDTLRAQLNTTTSSAGRKVYTSIQESGIQQKFSTKSWKEQPKSHNFGRG